MNAEVIEDILCAAGSRRDAVLKVLINAGLVVEPEVASDPEPSGPDTEAEADGEAVEDAEAEAEEPAETPES